MKTVLNAIIKTVPLKDIEFDAGVLFGYKMIGLITLPNPKNYIKLKSIHLKCLNHVCKSGNAVCRMTFDLKLIYIFNMDSNVSIFF